MTHSFAFYLFTFVSSWLIWMGLDWIWRNTLGRKWPKTFIHRSVKREMIVALFYAAGYTIFRIFFP